MIYTKGFWFLFAGACLAYFFVWGLASKGYGYAGYGSKKQNSAQTGGTSGYYGNRGPSFFYMGGANYFPNSSVRKGSIGGSRSFGGGPGRGK